MREAMPATIQTERVEGRFSALPRPFLRWAGSKQALLPQIRDVLPDTFSTYYEPFLGAGALFFALRPDEAVLGDASSELIGVWGAVRDNYYDLEEYLRPLKPDRDLYYSIRGNRSSDRVMRAAEFIYLNKTCWNGLYRVNKKGEFNVPYGRPRTDYIFDAVNLKECSNALAKSGVKIICQDFIATSSLAQAGDLVYFDPPYVTKHNYNGFRDWNESLFSWEDQERLAAEARRLRDAGVHVVVSNAAHRDILDLYSDFKQTIFDRPSTLSSNSKHRGRVEEVLIHAG